MRRPSYASVAATLALVVALGGTAYAAGLPKDSVRSKQIKNGAVKSLDIKDSGVTGVDVAADTLSGADIAESSLGVVPDAAALGGVPVSGYLRAPMRKSGSVLEGSQLLLAVPDYGTFVATCDDNNTPVADDDFANVGYFGDVGTYPGGGYVATVRRTTDNGASAAVTELDTPGPLQASTGSFERVEVVYTVQRLDGTRAMRLTARAWDDPTTIGCYGQLEVQVIS